MLPTGCPAATFTPSPALYVCHASGLWNFAAAIFRLPLALAASFVVDPYSCGPEPSLARCNPSWAVDVPVWLQPTHPICWLHGGLHVAATCVALIGAGDAASSSACHSVLSCRDVRLANANIILSQLNPVHALYFNCTLLTVA